MGGNRELLDGKKWEWNLNFRWEWEWDGNGTEVTEMGGIGTKNQFPQTSNIEVLCDFFQDHWGPCTHYIII